SFQRNAANARCPGRHQRDAGGDPQWYRRHCRRVRRRDDVRHLPRLCRGRPARPNPDTVGRREGDARIHRERAPAEQPFELPIGRHPRTRRSRRLPARDAGLMAAPTVAILGTGQAGFQAAASLRQEGFGGRIVLIGDEPVLPYQRPPLSKSYLARESGLVELWLRPETFYAKQKIDLVAGETVTAINRAERRLRLASGSELA